MPFLGVLNAAMSGKIAAGVLHATPDSSYL